VRKVAVVVMALMTLSLVGCATRASFVYKPSGPVATGAKTLPLKVAVNNFEDERQNENTNASVLYWIPLVPYSSLTYDRPDGANGFLFHSAYNFRPSEDYARAVVDELRQNGYFEEVFQTQRQNEPNVDLIVTGKIKKSRYDAKFISYGLSVYGPVLWFLGLPVGTTHNEVDLVLEMRRASDKRLLWSHEVKGEYEKTVGFYYNWGADFDGYPAILGDGLHKGMEKLAGDLTSKGIDYWKGTK